MNKKRILVYGFGGGLIGGVKSFLLNMFDHMSGKCLFDYVIDDDKCEREKDLIERSANIYFIPKKKKLFKNIAAWKKILSLWKEYGDIVYFNLSDLNYCVPVFMAKRMGYRVIVHAHNNSFANIPLLYRLFHHINKLLLSFTKIERLSNSDLSTKFLFGNKHATLVFNAISTKKYAFQSAKRTQLREQFDIPTDCTVYGFVGRLDYQKNPIKLVRIFHKIQNKIDNSKLIVVGDGNLKSEMIKEVERLGITKKIIFTGSVLNSEDIYNLMDVFILPSRFEGLGIVLVEAQASGLPCVATEGKIPNQVKITDAFSFVSLKQTDDYWADECIKMSKIKRNRLSYNSEVAKTRYNIVKEALFLENYLIGIQPKQ